MRDSSRGRGYGFSVKCPAKFDRNAECAIVLAHSTNVVIHHAGVRREKDYRKGKKSNPSGQRELSSLQLFADGCPLEVRSGLLDHCQEGDFALLCSLGINRKTGE